MWQYWKKWIIIPKYCASVNKFNLDKIPLGTQYSHNKTLWYPFDTLHGMHFSYLIFISSVLMSCALFLVSFLVFVKVYVLFSSGLLFIGLLFYVLWFEGVICFVLFCLIFVVSFLFFVFVFAFLFIVSVRNNGNDSTFKWWWKNLLQIKTVSDF